MTTLPAPTIDHPAPGFIVSTTQLRVDLWETRVFGPATVTVDEETYPTLEAAQAGHWKWMELWGRTVIVHGVERPVRQLEREGVSAAQIAALGATR